MRARGYWLLRGKVKCKEASSTPIAHGISITRREAQGKCGDFCLLLPALCLDTAHSQKTQISTFFLALTPLITKFRERWGLSDSFCIDELQTHGASKGGVKRN
jgi:hypothetical protein